jgi:PIN domain nuclease of toxin-antitoxin system
MLLLDTCSLLWLSLDQTKLSQNAFAAMTMKSASSFKGKEIVGSELFVSAISACEISLKYQKGLLILPLPPNQWFERAIDLHGLIELPVDHAIYICSVELPKIHLDPADRIMVATALAHNLAIITPDKHIQQYDVKTIW